MSDVASTYQHGRERLTALLKETPDATAQRCPTCPGWSVHDVMAHVAGVCSDIIAGRLDGVATEPWTAAQVEARRDRSLHDILAEWNDTAPQVEAIAEAFPERTGEQWVADMTTHEHDVRLALARPGARDSEGVDMGLGFLMDMMIVRASAQQPIPPLVVRAGGREWVVGEGAAGDARLETTPFELFRAVTGRRSAAQVRALGWNVDATPYLGLFSLGPFTTSTVDIPE